MKSIEEWSPWESSDAVEGSEIDWSVIRSRAQAAFGWRPFSHNLLICLWNWHRCFVLLMLCVVYFMKAWDCFHGGPHTVLQLYITCDLDSSPYRDALDHSFVVVYLLSHIWLFVTPWTVAHQAPLSMGFPRQESWNGLLFPSPGALPDPGIEPVSPALQGDSLLLSHQGSILWLIPAEQ